MDNQMSKAESIAAFLNSRLYGKNFTVSKPCSLNNPEQYCLVFVNKYSDKTVEKLNDFSNILAIVTGEYKDKLNCSYIIADNPKLKFAMIVQQFFSAPQKQGIAKTAVTGENVILGQAVTIGEYAVIGDNVKIGDRTEIRNHVVIAQNTIIGSDCLIKSHTVIGEEGFGFAFQDDMRPVRIPHLGTVEIGNNVELGAFNSVARATLDKTIIHDFVKTDDHVHIAHNSIIQENSILTACTELSGGVLIGKNVWVGPNVSLKEKVTIGDNAMIGIGAVVIKDVAVNSVVIGNPAKHLKDRF
jgi:UDP-3-O-[3-hydroxymyristoyl] glucosamine N-acyltransferase